MCGARHLSGRVSGRWQLARWADLGARLQVCQRLCYRHRWLYEWDTGVIRVGQILGYGARLQVTLWVGAAACGSVGVRRSAGRHVIQWLGAT